MTKITLVFDIDIYVEYKLLDHKLALGWFDLLQRQCNNKTHYIEDGFTGFGEDYTLPKIQSLLLEAINYIEEQRPNTLPINKILEEIKEEKLLTQNLLNELHFIYERIAEDPNYNFETKLQKSVNNLNMYIHKLETEKTRRGNISNYNRVRCRFLPNDRYEFGVEKKQIVDEDNHLFSLNLKVGGIKLNYAQIGKDFLECFRRKDIITKPKPLEKYSASFVADFGPFKFEAMNRKMAEMKKWYTDLGYNIDDPKNRLGYVYVAELVDNKNIDNIISRISEKRKLVRVIVE